MTIIEWLQLTKKNIRLLICITALFAFIAGIIVSLVVMATKDFYFSEKIRLNVNNFTH